MTTSSNKLEQLRQTVLGNNRGREVEVEPSGEIRLAETADGSSQNYANDKPGKLSKMSKHTFGA